MGLSLWRVEYNLYRPIIRRRNVRTLFIVDISVVKREGGVQGDPIHNSVPWSGDAVQGGLPPMDAGHEGSVSLTRDKSPSVNNQADFPSRDNCHIHFHLGPQLYMLTSSKSHSEQSQCLPSRGTLIPRDTPGPQPGVHSSLLHQPPLNLNQSKPPTRSVVPQAGSLERRAISHARYHDQ